MKVNMAMVWGGSPQGNSDRDRISGDRRTDRRYPARLGVKYQVWSGTEVVLEGDGYTEDLSSGGVLLRADRELPLGMFIEMRINWPVPLGNACPLHLRASGHVVRSDRQGSAVAVTRFEFRTHGERGFHHEAARSARNSVQA